MAITAAMVKELREMTGAGMMDCKKALTETNGDMDAAVDVLKKSGAAKMEKKQSRIAAEGIARVAVNGNVAVVAEVNSETDFVAKNETFQEFVQTVADTALASDLNGGANGDLYLTIIVEEKSNKFTIEENNVFVDLYDMIYDKNNRIYTNTQELLRRLYVACSRAKKKLILCYNKYD